MKLPLNYKSYKLYDEDADLIAAVFDEANAAFIVKACNEYENLLKRLKKLEVAANTVNGCYSRNPKNFALALKSLEECAAEAREAIKRAEDE